MRHELEARTLNGMEEKIENLETMLDNMSSDFAKCAQGISECFFCANDENCVNPDEHGCHFIWKKHN